MYLNRTVTTLSTLTCACASLNEVSVWTEIDLLTGFDRLNIVCLSPCALLASQLTPSSTTRASSLAQNTTSRLSSSPAESSLTASLQGQVYRARHRHRHPLRPPRLQVLLLFSLSPPPFTYFIDPKTFSTVPMTPTASSSSTLACKSIPHS